MAKAFAYLRVSGKAQVKGDGFTRQQAAIRKFAADRDIKIMKVFREEGVSGAKELANRPALSELMKTLHGNGVKMVLVERLDRLARDLMVQETIIADLRKYGFSLLSVAEPDLLEDDPTRKLLRQMMGAVAEYEKSMIVMKLRGARQRKKALTGRCEGRKPFGHYPGENRAIERMKELRADGYGFDRLAARLDEEGLRTRTGKPWHGFTINQILARQTAGAG